MEPTYHSQHGEDKFIAENLQLPTKGSFVEVGAYDGVLSSNTLHFEQKGWDGLLIEADSKTGHECRNNRKAVTLITAVGTNVGVRPYFINFQDRGLSGLEREGVKTHTPVQRLDDLIGDYLMNNIDLLSIDTEGTELDVWKSIGDIRPQIVIVEYFTLGLPPNNEAIVRQFTKDGYTEVHRTACNCIFVLDKTRVKA